MPSPPADGYINMQQNSSKRQTAWRAVVAALAYGLLLRCGLMDLQERLLTQWCAAMLCQCFSSCTHGLL